MMALLTYGFARGLGRTAGYYGVCRLQTQFLGCFLPTQPKRVSRTPSPTQQCGRMRATAFVR